MYKYIFGLLKVVVMFNLLIGLINLNVSAIFICLLNFILLFISDYLQKKIKYSDFIKLLIYFFLIGSLLGGEVCNLYSKIWFFDIILHTLSSFIISSLFLSIFKLLKPRINKWIAMICVFSFAMMIAGIWEIFEFSVDRILDKDMQKDTVIKEINSAYLSLDGNSIIKKKINSTIIDDITINGYLDIGLYDTIGDMVCALIGSILFIVYKKRSFNFE